MRHALGFRLAIWYAVLFVGSSILVVSLTYVLLASSLRQRDHELIRSTLDKYATAYLRGGLSALQGAITSDRVAGRHERLLVRVLGSHAEAIFFTVPDNWSQADLDRLARQAPATGQDWTTVGGRGRELLEVASARLPDGTLIQVGKSSESRAQLLEHFRAVILLVLLSVLAIGLVGSVVFTRRTLEPVRHLAAAVRTIVGTGRVEARVPVRNTGDPLDELTLLFNGMLDRISGLIAGMRGALDNVAHDLRTPMTRLRGIAERALGEPGSPEAYREALSDVLEESDRVVAMLDTLMDISEAETGAMRLKTEPVNVRGVLDDTAGLYADLAEDKHLALNVVAPADVSVRADRNRLRQVVANLVDNAVKYTSAGGEVHLEARLDGDEAAISVRDTGPGIAPEHLPHVWDRLYRADQSRSERGLGLGLSLVRAIVQAHGGRVTVESRPGAGSRFTIVLPATHTAGSGPAQ